MKIGFTASSFDLLHAGHILMLKEAKENCDYLIVGFNVNPENKSVIQSVYERYVQLEAVKYIDKIIPYSTEQDLLKLIQTQQIDIRFLGDDYKNKPFTGDKINVEIYFISREHGFSSTELKQRCTN